MSKTTFSNSEEVVVSRHIGTGGMREHFFKVHDRPALSSGNDDRSRIYLRISATKTKTPNNR